MRSVSIASVLRPGLRFGRRFVVRFGLVLGLVLGPVTVGSGACKKTPEGDREPDNGDRPKDGERAAQQPVARDKLVYVSPDPIGVNPFLSMGKSGIEKAAQKHGLEARTFQAEDPTTRRDSLRAAVDAGAKVVAVLGFQFNDAITEMAREHPEVQFLIVDQCVDERPDNLHCAMFREHESTFLLGAAAALLTKSNHLGVVCALDIPFMHRFTDGFTQGAKHVKPDVKVDVRWVGGQSPFADPVRAKELAITLAAGGADIIFASTAGGDFGIFEAAAEKDFYLMGVDVNHCPDSNGRMYDTALKRVDTAMVETIDRILAGEKKVKAEFGLKEGGGGLIALDGSAAATASHCLIAQHSDVIARVVELRDKLVSGEIKLADPMFAAK